MKIHFKTTYLLAGMMLAFLLPATSFAGQETEAAAEATAYTENASAKDAVYTEDTARPEDVAYPAGDPDEVAAVILHTNDVHCALEDRIGYDGLALYKKELEELYGKVLLVDAGDAIQGSTIGSISRGAQIVKAMNYVGYDLAILGNHEFDYGFDVLDDCAEQLQCGYTCANFCTSDGTSVFEPYRILETESGLKIALIGVDTPDTFTKSNIKDVLDEVGDPMYDFLADETGDRLCTALQGYIDDARAHGADYVILVSHLGNNDDVTPVFRCDAVVSHLTGLDMVIDGHSHEIYNITMTQKDGTEIPAAKTGSQFKTIGQLTIYKDGRLEEKLIEEVPAPADLPYETVTRGSVERYVDPETKAFLDQCYADYADVLERKICDLPFDLVVLDPDRQISARLSENGLCELAADAFRAISGAQTALINAGTVRNNLYAGEVTYNSILNMMPYSSEMVVANVTGQMILDALESGTAMYPHSDGRFPQISGITYTFHPKAESTVRMDEKNQFISVDGNYRVSDVKIEGKNLDPKAEYTLVTTSFLLNGGDGYTMFKEADTISVLPKNEDELLVQYIEEDLKGTIPEIYQEPLGRVQIADSPAA